MSFEFKLCTLWQRYFFVIKPIRCTNFPNSLRHESLHISCSSSAHHQEFTHFTLGTGICHTGFEDSFWAGPPWSCSKAVFKFVWRIPVPSVQWINSWWWAEELHETCRVSCRSKFGKLVNLVGFIIKKFVTMYGHMNVKFDRVMFYWNTMSFSDFNHLRIIIIIIIIIIKTQSF